ncbi:zymogen granule membrane protein 16-like [Corythoichthys intestinalis]|uniref:zymogen granule membrane protein 16-like n=1 Tax=Corythoichthys intestinalis TaxID=161448 RepID=UPI0025A5A2B5|nr:zymogen granule membrane protein 16-like [Corythoichthys intestinalis]XP_061808343.1 zymogen granule membrane protein 16-like [Nerophis lumbriciformis]
MRWLTFISLLSVTALADYPPDIDDYFSFSKHVGSGVGISYGIVGKGRITGVRVWEANNNYIYGIQLRYGYAWTNITGYPYGQVQEMKLFEGEAIVQLSGKYSHYVQSLVFTTNMGRSLFAGQPRGHSFNMYPRKEKAELRFISGRYNGAITSIGAHWGVVSDPYRKTPNYL